MMNLITLAKLLLIIGGIAWGVYGSMGINMVKRIIPSETGQKVVYIAVGLASLVLMFNRNFYLPFLSNTVVPKSLLDKDRVPIDSTISVEVTVAPYSRVIYWASEKPKDKSQMKDTPVQVAYGEFANSGITTADANGKAHLVLKKPKSYVVKRGIFKKRLRPHIHYRYTLSDGMLSQVFTKRLSKNDLRKASIRSRSSSRSCSSHSKTSRSSSRSRSPLSDLTKLRSCSCAQRHLNIHEPGCKVAFVIPNPNIGMAPIVSAPVASASATKPKSIEKYGDVDIYEADRSLEHVLQDRAIGSNDGITGIYDYAGLDDSKYSAI